MPISGPSSYLPTIDEFSTHWGAADATLGAGNEIALADGTVRAGLIARRGDLDTARTDVSSKMNDVELARAVLEDGKKNMLLRLSQFIDKVRAYFAGSKWERALPLQPSLTDGQATVVDAMVDAQTLWAKMNADPAIAVDPTLLGGYTQANFAAELVTLKAAYTSYTAEKKLLNVEIGQRDDVQKVIQPILVSYRRALPTFFAAESAMVSTLPRLTPEPGATPEPVVATIEIDPVTGMVWIRWSAYAGTNLAKFQVRVTSGLFYSNEDDEIVLDVLPGEPREVLTLAGVPSPGMTAQFRVFAITDTGNEAGSNTVGITRPGTPIPPP